MKRILSTSEVVETIQLEGHPWEVLAAAEANYDATQSSLIVELSVQLRTPGLKSVLRKRPIEWLPTGGAQQEVVSAEDANPVAREIFHSWVKRLRKAIVDSQAST